MYVLFCILAKYKLSQMKINKYSVDNVTIFLYRRSRVWVSSVTPLWNHRHNGRSTHNAVVATEYQRSVSYHKCAVFVYTSHCFVMHLCIYVCVYVRLCLFMYGAEVVQEIQCRLSSHRQSSPSSIPSGSSQRRYQPTASNFQRGFSSDSPDLLTKRTWENLTTIYCLRACLLY